MRRRRPPRGSVNCLHLPAIPAAAAGRHRAPSPSQQRPQAGPDLLRCPHHRCIIPEVAGDDGRVRPAEPHEPIGVGAGEHLRHQPGDLRRQTAQRDDVDVEPFTRPAIPRPRLAAMPATASCARPSPARAFQYAGFVAHGVVRQRLAKRPSQGHRTDRGRPAAHGSARAPLDRVPERRARTRHRRRGRPRRRNHDG